MKVKVISAVTAAAEKEIQDWLDQAGPSRIISVTQISISPQDGSSPNARQVPPYTTIVTTIIWE
jgi:hypothetical protein